MSFNPISQNVNQNAQNISVEADLDSLKDSLSELKKTQEYIFAKMTEMSRELEARKKEGINILNRDLQQTSSIIHESDFKMKQGAALVGSIAGFSLASAAPYIENPAIFAISFPVGLSFTFLPGLYFALLTRSNRIIEKIKKLETSLTFKQAHQMIPLIVKLQFKHPSFITYKTEGEYKWVDEYDYEEKKYKRVAKWDPGVKVRYRRVNSEDSAIEFLIPRYQLKLFEKRTRHFNKILINLESWVNSLPEMVIQKNSVEDWPDCQFTYANIMSSNSP